MHCPYCNALNPDDAKWCGLCLKSLEKPASARPNGAAKPVQPPPQEESMIAAPVQIRGNQGEQVEALWQAVDKRFGATEQKADPTWTCTVCDSANPIALNNCAVCGTSIFDVYRKEKPREVLAGKSAGVAAALSVLPGAGHLYIGRAQEGIVRIILAVWWLALGGLLVSGPSVMVPIGALILLAFFGLMGLSVYDAYRGIADPGEPALLNNKIIFYSSLIVVILAVIGAFLALAAMRV